MTGRPVPGPAGADAVAHVFVDALDDRCEIVGDDGHHLERVRRITQGETVTAADGSGAWRAYDVAQVTSGRLVLVARKPVAYVAEPAVGVALAVALTKGGLDDVVAAVTEIGVERVTPIRTARTVVRWDEARAARAVARLRVVAREASMQSRRVRVPVIDDLVPLTDLVQRPGVVVADVGGVAVSELPRPIAVGGRAVHTVVIGPEGGFDPSELARFATAPKLALGPNVLRAATAPLVAVAVLVQAVSTGFVD